MHASEIYHLSALENDGKIYCQRNLLKGFNKFMLIKVVSDLSERFVYSKID